MNDCWLVDGRERVFFFFFWREEEFGLISDLIYYWKYRSFEDESKACRVSEWINLNRLLSNDQWKWSKECAIMTSKYVTREISYVLVIDHRCMHEIKTILFFSSFVAFFSFFFFHLISYRHRGFLVYEICVHQSNSIEMLFRTTNASKRMLEQSRSVDGWRNAKSTLRIDITKHFTHYPNSRRRVFSLVRYVRYAWDWIGDSCFEIELNNKTRTRGDDRW